jgi:hypothetical protein
MALQQSSFGKETRKTLVHAKVITFGIVDEICELMQEEHRVEDLYIPKGPKHNADTSIEMTSKILAAKPVPLI